MTVRFRVVLLVLSAFCIGALVAVLALPQVRENVLPEKVRSFGAAAIGGPFTLVDQTGKQVTQDDFRGRYMLVYFGFTNCPDVCPAALQVMAAALETLGDKANRVTPVFITLDPERDTPQLLSDYLNSFPGTVGLTGTEEQIAAVARAYRVYYKKVDDKASGLDYTVDHTSIIYLMDEQGRFVSHYSHATSADKMAEKLASIL